MSSGLDKLCFTFVCSDEGWELRTRNATTSELVADPNQYPVGIPALVASLAAKGVGIKLGLYGAASGVTCGGVSGQLGYEDLDAATLARWGVGYWKSDNCASYAMDPSVRFAATRDALLRTKAPIVYSIEPFSISPDTRQSSNLANLWRVGKDISRTWEATLNRASISDKWAPLAGPGGFNDPDMMNVGPHLTLGENRVLFGLWCIMKAPLLLSADLPALPAPIQAVLVSPELIAINQDPLGVQARKLVLDGAVMPWLVGFESCAAGVGGGAAGMRNRGWNNSPPPDTRVWRAEPHGSVPGAVALVNVASGRCLVPGTAQNLSTVVLLPCNPSDAAQAWSFGTGGAQTVAALVHNASGLALVAGNGTLFSDQHNSYDQAALPDAAYGAAALGLGPFLPSELRRAAAPAPARTPNTHILCSSCQRKRALIAAARVTSPLNSGMGRTSWTALSRRPRTWRPSTTARTATATCSPRARPRGSTTASRTYCRFETRPATAAPSRCGAGRCRAARLYWACSTPATSQRTLRRPSPRWAWRTWARVPPSACERCLRPPRTWAPSRVPSTQPWGAMT